MRSTELKLFICNRSIDSDNTAHFLDKLKAISGDSIAILRESEHSENWKERVGEKIKEVDCVLFFLGCGPFKSEPMKWELQKAKELNKRIIGIELPSATSDRALCYLDFPIFRKPCNCWEYLQMVYQEDLHLLLEQYKIMSDSTVKVTDQRQRVNNLFFTVTASILSVSLVFGKTFEFSIVGASGMLILAIMVLIVTFLWEKLLSSYGTLNRGKFKIIKEIEKKLKTNMFQHEWEILKDIGYEPNTKTEVTVVRRFRWFVCILIFVEAAYLVYALRQFPAG